MGVKNYIGELQLNGKQVATIDQIPAPQYSEGLEYTLNDDGVSYSVSRIGTCTDTDIVIASTYEGKPVTTIASFAFDDNDEITGITSVTIPNSIIEIGNYAFQMSTLEKIIFEEGSRLTKIGMSAFDYSDIESIEIPDSVTSIDYSAFSSCSKLTSVVIPDSVTSINGGAFYNCTNLKGITIPDSVTYIGESAFEGCSSLTIYCEAESKPDSWDDNWNRDVRPVVWGAALDFLAVNDKINEFQASGIAELLDTNVKLSEDLYAYAPIGNAQTASNKVIGSGSTKISNTNPGKIASSGSSLKDVFNVIFGEAKDNAPSISNNSSLTATGGKSYSGSEYGTTISVDTQPVKFTLARTGTAQYGYRCGDTDDSHKNTTTFYYPIMPIKLTDGKEAQIQITLPNTISNVEDITQNSVAYKKIIHDAAGDKTDVTVLVPQSLYKGYSGKVLYCDFAGDSISLSIKLPQKSSTTSQQTRYEAISASVQLGDPQDAEGKEITKFLTYFEQQGKEAVATAETPSAAGEKTNSTSAYTITAGSYYPYYLASTSDTLESVAKNVATRFSSSSSAVSIELASDAYVWFLLPPSTSGSKTIQYEALGNWYDFVGGTTGPSNIELTLNSSTDDNTVTATYKGYRTIKQAAAGTTKFMII